MALFVVWANLNKTSSHIPGQIAGMKAFPLFAFSTPSVIEFEDGVTPVFILIQFGPL